MFKKPATLLYLLFVYSATIAQDKKENLKPDIIAIAQELDESNVISPRQTMGYMKYKGSDIRKISFTIYKREDKYFMTCHFIAFNNGVFASDIDDNPYCFNPSSEIIFETIADREVSIPYVGEPKCNSNYSESDGWGSHQRIRLTGLFYITDSSKEILENQEIQNVKIQFEGRSEIIPIREDMKKRYIQYGQKKNFEATKFLIKSLNQ